MANINFGNVKESILINLTESYLNNTEISESIITDFSNIVNESKILKLQNEVYEKLTTKTIESDNLATRYIDNTMKLFESFTINEFNKENKKLELFLAEKNIQLKENNEINKDINNLITYSLKTTKKPNVDQLHESFVNVLDVMKTKKEINGAVIETEVEIITEDVLKIAISKYNKKYSDLTESDNQVLKVLVENDYSKKTELFSELKKSTITLLESIENSEGKDDMANGYGVYIHV